MATDAPKSFDVTRPGKASPDASSKPLIVTNKPEVKDPMVAAGVTSTAKPEQAADKKAEDTKAAEKEEPTTEVAVTGSMRSKLAPLSDKEKTDAGIETNDEEAAKKTSEEKASEGSAIVDAVAEQADNKKVEKDKSVEDVAKQEAVQKLIDSKQYVVPIGIESGKKKSHTGMVVLLLLLLVVVGGYLALDAGALKLGGFEVPYHLIGNK